MEQFRMKPFGKRPELEVSVPGSKSITNRALLLAALAHGESLLKGVLFSDDSRVFMQALRELGYEIFVDEAKRQVRIRGTGEKIPKSGVKVHVGSAGTAARFLTAMLALSGGRYEMTASEQMKKRPMKPLLLALEQLGTKFLYQERPYSFPFTICGRERTDCGGVDLNIDESSQFLSALLLAGVMEPGGFGIHLTGNRDAKSYVKISMKMMEEFGAKMEQTSEQDYVILPGQRYAGREYQIEPDVSAACYFYAMAAVNGGQALVRHVHFDSTQGDIRFLRILEQMGCRLRDEKEGLRLTAPADGRLTGIQADMSDCSDQTMTLAAVAPFAEGVTEIRGVGHIRGQESDRIRGIVTELNRLGVPCEEREAGLCISPAPEEVLAGEREVVIQTYEDHRMAMAFAIVGTRIPGIVIDNPLCCWKTFENYFDILLNLNLNIEN